MPKHPLLNKIIAWAQSEAPIRALVITGSLARADGSTDEWSDLDLQVIARQFDQYTRDDGWLDALGTVWIRFPLDKSAPYRLVWFAGGVKVDFQFSTTAALDAMHKRGELSAEYQRGYLVALDKDGRFQTLPPSPRIFPQPPPPSAAELHAVINEFWFEAIHVAQFIRRREFWVVKFRDWTMKCNLLQVMEWHSRAIGKSANTWLIGRRIADWLDPESRAALPGIWAGWDAAALWQSLLLQTALFERLSQELSAQLGYPHHSARHAQITAYIRSLRAGDDAAPNPS